MTIEIENVNRTSTETQPKLRISIAVLEKKRYKTIPIFMIPSDGDVQAERIESLKAGTLAAFCLFLVYGVATLGNQMILARQFPLLARLEIFSSLNLLISGAIAWFSGFLFGVTYRYAVRTDQNSHLGDGVVFAFGLVRGLAQAEAGLNCPNALWSGAVLGVESIVLFAFARFILDWAIANAWVKPLK